MNHTDMVVIGGWDLLLVVLSYVVAVFVSAPITTTEGYPFGSCSNRRSRAVAGP